MKRHGLSSVCWVVIKEFGDSMIVKHRITGEIQHIKK